MLVEPVFHVGFVLVLLTVVRTRVVPGAEAAVWLLVSLVTFFTTRNIFTRGMGAINANQALFAYRQVLPVDVVLVRAALETFLGVIVMVILLSGEALLGYQVVPHNPLQALAAFVGLCLCGLGLGLALSVASELLPELGKVAKLLFKPLYLLSGVVVPLSLIPAHHRAWFFYSPFAHGLELVRGGFFPLYHVAPEADMGYLFCFALAALFLGLALHVRYAIRLRAQ